MATYANTSRTAAEETLAAQANSLFLQLVQSVPGVVHVEPFGGAAAGEQSFRVYVRDGDPEAERAVSRAKGSVYDRYPEAGLDVEVLEESDLPQAKGEVRPESAVRPTPHPEQLGSLPSPETKTDTRAAPAV